MSAFGLMLIGFGILTAWAGFDRQLIFNVLRSFIGAPATATDQYGKAQSTGKRT